MVRYTPLGGASEIGGSSGVLEAFGVRLVIDAGLRPKKDDARYPDFEQIEIGGGADAVLVTHAHMDHTGGLPVLHRMLPETSVFATAPTVRIARTLLRDSVSIMDRDWEGEPDFTLEDVDSLMRSFVPVEFNTPVVVVSNDRARVTVKFVPAGHILGAAMLAIEFEQAGSGRLERVLISGDISTFEQPTLHGTDIEAVRGFRPSLFICEGTYGTEVHNDIHMEEALFVQRVAKVLERGGRVLIPAFAVGRAQNVTLILRRAFEDPAYYRKLLKDPDFKMPKALVVIDGMCRTIADEYSAFRTLLRDEHQDVKNSHIFYSDDGYVRPVRSTDEREKYKEWTESPIVFISSSGMLTGGPSVGYAQVLLDDPKSAILLCGYQDEESPGHALKNLTRKVDSTDEFPTAYLEGGRYTVKCEVDQYGLSAHSDANGITELFAAVNPLRMLLVHGTPTRLAGLQQRLQDYARSEGMQSLVEIAHKDEPVEVSGTERFDEPAFYRSSAEMPRWGKMILNGSAFHGGSDLSAASAWVNAGLLVGRNHPLTDEEVARLDTISDGMRPLGADEVAIAREAMQVAEGLLWSNQKVGREKHFLPRLPSLIQCKNCGAYLSEDDPRQRGPCPTCGEKAGWSEPVIQEPGIEEVMALATDRVRSQMRISGEELQEHRERVHAMGVGLGDLIIYVAGTQEYIRLIPALLRNEVKDGYEVEGPSATDPMVGYNQIVARIGPWPGQSGPRKRVTPLESQLLTSIGRALSALTLEFLMNDTDSPAGEKGVRDRGRALFSLWTQVPGRDVSPVAASLASILLVTWNPSSIIQCTVDDLVDLFGGDAVASPMLIVGALRELVDRGFLQMREVNDGLQLQWTELAQSSLTTRSDTARVFRPLGSSFERLLREGFHRAIQEIERMGILQSYRKRDSTAFRLKLPGPQGQIPPPPRGTAQSSG